MGTEVLRQAVTEPSSTSNSELAISVPQLRNEKIIATGSGITVGIALMEPVLFLGGFNHCDPSSRKATILRGQLHIKAFKCVGIKKVSICFRGRAQTDWPDGNFPLNPKVFEGSVPSRQLRQLTSPGLTLPEAEISNGPRYSGRLKRIHHSGVVCGSLRANQSQKIMKHMSFSLFRLRGSLQLVIYIFLTSVVSNTAKFLLTCEVAMNRVA
ncbi:uncharacterized protein BJX67DRAFT_348514 [Aspergillus lucknowensis]|uniref:Uncharacterized protein n=1 Tax=Aspergillus lucknowensis TaxID=176173 RepID=A0ABR4LX21_9EURO